MLGTITEIIDNNVLLKLSVDLSTVPNLIGLHVIFEDKDKKMLGEVVNTTKTDMKINLIGEIRNNEIMIGTNVKPSFNSTVRIIKGEELPILFGKQEIEKGTTNFGTSIAYEGYRINVPINNFFNTHFAILGNSGSGKSSGVASILQKLFLKKNPPVDASIFLIDAYGEYTNAFNNIHNVHPELNYKTYTTNLLNPQTEILRIPIWLLDVDDLALLLDASNTIQLPIIEKTLKLVRILTGSGEEVIRKKNDIIARAVQNILLSSNDVTKIHDLVISVLTKFNTPSLNLNSTIAQPGYVRTLKQCLFIDKTGKMQDIELVVEFIRSYIQDDVQNINYENINQFYTLKDLELSLEFALISEGILQSDKVFDYANVLRVRLHSLANEESKQYFSYPNYVTMDEYIRDLETNRQTGAKSQIINFNVNYVDDRLAKVMVKIISRMIFKKASTTKPIGSRAYHIIVEEAHRYVQKDNDRELLGYNIFERISKEGRKYGVILGLITQRPSELSDTCISQCANFIVFKTLHPKDLKYIGEMVPHITNEILQKLKILKPGNCIAFGMGFKIPTIIKIDMPNPPPTSNNIDLEDKWYNNIQQNQNINPMYQQMVYQDSMNKYNNIQPQIQNTSMVTNYNYSTNMNPQQNNLN